jgi:hypothetical protein
MKTLSGRQKALAWLCGALLAGLALVLFFSLHGDTPRAPVLKDEPVYQNGREGFRFLVPEGWTVVSRGEAPSGKAGQEWTLVEHQLYGVESQTILRVTCVDLPQDADVQDYLTKHWPGATLTPVSPPEPIRVDGVEGTDTLFSLGPKNGPIVHEVYAFRRGGRVYLFTGIFAEEDSRARQQVRRAVESIQWRR